MPKVINAKKTGYSGYLYFNGTYILHKKTEEKQALTAGIYSLSLTQDGQTIISPISAMTDDLIQLPTFISQKVINEINKFWAPGVKERYHKYGMIYKRGILLHGKQGTGKTSIIATVMEEHVKKGGIVFFCPGADLLHKVTQAIREIEGDKPFLVIYEELDKLLNYDEGGFLSLLDGENQIDNVVYIATTNYLHAIPARIKNRPSRFASVIEVGVPDAPTREAFLRAKIKEDIDFTLWVKLTEGMTIDQIKDLIISVYCIDIPLKEAVEKILSMESVEEDAADENETNPYSRNNTKLLEQLFGRQKFKDLI